MANEDNTTPPREPDDWKSGDDPMTDAQRVYLDTLAGQAGEPTPSDDLTKAEASEEIDQLRDEADMDGTDEAITTESDPDLDPSGERDR